MALSPILLRRVCTDVDRSFSSVELTLRFSHNSSTLRPSCGELVLSSFLSCCGEAIEGHALRYVKWLDCGGIATMAAVVQCANARSLRTGAARVATPSAVSSSGSGRDGVQSWSPRGFWKAGGERAQGRGVVSMALAHGDGEEIESCDSPDILRFAQKTVVALALSLSLSIGGADMAEAKRLEGVNKPELLPKEFTTVIDVAGFLSAGQEDRIKNAVATLEQDTGYKLRVLAQNYPTTPGLAVRDFWSVDDNTVVFVADPSLGNILNFNVGAGVDLSIPRSFWTRLAGKYGNKFYWQEMGEDASIEAAVNAIGECLREPAGPRACSDIK